MSIPEKTVSLNERIAQACLWAASEDGRRELAESGKQAQVTIERYKNAQRVKSDIMDKPITR